MLAGRYSKATRPAEPPVKAHLCRQAPPSGSDHVASPVGSPAAAAADPHQRTYQRYLNKPHTHTCTCTHTHTHTHSMCTCTCTCTCTGRRENARSKQDDVQRERGRTASGPERRRIREVSRVREAKTKRTGSARAAGGHVPKADAGALASKNDMSHEVCPVPGRRPAARASLPTRGPRKTKGLRPATSHQRSWLPMGRARAALRGNQLALSCPSTAGIVTERHHEVAIDPVSTVARHRRSVVKAPRCSPR